MVQEALRFSQGNQRSQGSHRENPSVGVGSEATANGEAPATFSTSFSRHRAASAGILGPVFPTSVLLQGCFVSPAVGCCRRPLSCPSSDRLWGYRKGRGSQNWGGGVEVEEGIAVAPQVGLPWHQLPVTWSKGLPFPNLKNVRWTRAPVGQRFSNSHVHTNHLEFIKNAGSDSGGLR